MSKVSVLPVKGFRDFVPSDWKIQTYIFDRWKNVCKNYGFQEYNGPVLEDIQIYNKSGQDVGTFGKELYNLTDRGDRVLALRPEMTPTVGRMIAAYGNDYAKLIRWFSIAQFFRAENPQKGRGREFFQLNADIFGSETIYTDFEVISLAIDIMKAFGATSEMFVAKINNRKFIDYYFKEILKINDNETKKSVVRLIDAYPKKDKEWLVKELESLNLKESVGLVEKYLNLNLEDLKSFDDQSSREIVELLSLLEKANLKGFCVFDPTITRGFDYYTGMVFEVFDKNPENKRSLFGGGRYDDLLNIFDKPKIPAVGFAPGDMTTKIFLENWGLLKNLDNKEALVYIPILCVDAISYISKIATNLRLNNKSVIIGIKEENISKALDTANKMKAIQVVIIGQDELARKVYKIKDMESGGEEHVEL